MNQYLTDKYKKPLPDKEGRCLVVHIKRIGLINGYYSTYQMIKADCNVVCSVSKNITDAWMWDNGIGLMWDNNNLIKLK